MMTTSLYEGVMSHVWVSHVSRMNESCRTCEWVMWHIWMHKDLLAQAWTSHVTYMNESFDSYSYYTGLLERGKRCETKYNLRATLHEPGWELEITIRGRLAPFRLFGSAIVGWTHCDTLWHTATHCDTLQHTVWYDSAIVGCAMASPPTLHCNALQHTATHCNTLWHTATYCNTLQHTTTMTNISHKSVQLGTQGTVYIHYTADVRDFHFRIFMWEFSCENFHLRIFIWDFWASTRRHPRTWWATVFVKISQKSVS